MSKESAGVSAFARIFVRIAQGDAYTVAQLVESEGLIRSTTFDVVKRMDVAGLIARQIDGKMAPGPIAGEFAYASFHLKPIYGPAQTLLPWLREKTNASVALQATDGATVTTLLSYLAHWDRSKPGAKSFVTPITYRGNEVARLRLTCCASDSAEAIDRAERLAMSTAKELQGFLVV